MMTIDVLEHCDKYCRVVKLKVLMDPHECRSLCASFNLLINEVWVVRN